MANFSKFSSNTTADFALKLRDLTEDKDIVFSGAINGKVIVLHSFTNLGGTRSCKTTTAVRLMSLGTNATGDIFVQKSIVSSKKFKGVEGTIILKCDTKYSIIALKNNTSFTLGAFFFTAPLTIKAAMNL